MSQTRADQQRRVTRRRKAVPATNHQQASLWEAAPFDSALPLNDAMAREEATILFSGLHEAYGYFSNFAAYPISLDGKTWPTVEHYF